ncbi:murein L,D-transpeptidase catalytic domain family protein [Halopseudomonas sp.]|uniref:murein L,D-transpeptidase catalytic domain family protein n=1 Tax=Halopseudomonas sp. TaxID=2901191 RepID=UPI00300276D3|tara:strand:+ start:5817 stop:6539 length:723 start_codon:yes stop_codon:yes gene_type:complete
MLTTLRRAGALAAVCLSIGSTSVQAVTNPPALITPLASQLSVTAPDLNEKVLNKAVMAMECAVANGAKPAARLAVIDFSLPSAEERLWIFDLQSKKLLLQDLVAHGSGSGDNYAAAFSNIEGSHQSSIGLFRTAESYTGRHGYSLRMDGLERGINDLARQRAIVIHAADYVDPGWVARYGRIGRSQGCPAVRPEVAGMVVDKLKGGQFMFSYYPDEHWLATSEFLNCNKAQGQLLAQVER